MNKLIILLLFFIQLTFDESYAKTTNTIYKNPAYGSDFQMGTSAPLLVNNRLVFLGKYQENYAVWSMNESAQEKELLVDLGSERVFGLNKIGDYIYFTDTRKVWKTNGVQSGTTEIYSSYGLSSHIRNSGDILYSVKGSTEVITFVDDTPFVVPLTDHPVGASISDLCAFEKDNFIVYSSSGLPEIEHFKNGSVTLIQIPQINESLKMVNYNGHCIVVVDQPESNKQVWQVNADGSFISMNDTLFSSGNIKSILSHGEHIFVFHTDIDQKSTLKRLSMDISSVDLEVELNDPTSELVSLVDWSSQQDYIRLNSSLNLINSPGVDPSSFVMTHFYSKDLDQIENGEFLQDKPDLYQSNSEKFLFFPNNNRLLTNAFDNDENQQSLPLSLYQTHVVISDKDSDSLFVFSKDPYEKNVLSKLDETINIGDQINGLWGNPSIENQGLVIKKGQRQNGSEYIVVSIYTFQDGNPFWLAGDIDIQHPEKDITVDMYEFQGPSFLESNITPERIAFGQLNIQMKSCDSINVTLTSNGIEFSTEMLRIDDTTYSGICFDASE